MAQPRCTSEREWRGDNEEARAAIARTPRPRGGGGGRGCKTGTTAVMGMLILVLSAFAAVAGPGTALASTVSNPAVQGPIEGGVRGYPWNKSLFGLSTSRYSYTENEYFFSGTATNLEQNVSAPY